MTTLKQIEKEQQTLARCKQSLALEQLKKRKADTRSKIELGGLVVKSGLDCFGKAVVLGILIYSSELIEKDIAYLKLFENIGQSKF